MDTDHVIEFADTYGDNYTAIYLATIINAHTTGHDTFKPKHIYQTYSAIADHNPQFEPRGVLMQAHADGESTLSRYVNLSPRYFKRKVDHLRDFHLIEPTDDTDDSTYRLIDPPADPETLLNELEAHSTLTFPPGILDTPPQVERTSNAA